MIMMLFRGCLKHNIFIFIFCHQLAKQIQLKVLWVGFRNRFSSKRNKLVNSSQNSPQFLLCLNQCHISNVFNVLNLVVF